MLSLKKLWAQHPLYMHIATVFTLLVFAAGTIIGWGNYFQGRNVALAGAEEVFERMERESRLEIENLRTPAEAVIDGLSAAPLTEARTMDERLNALSGMARVLDKQVHLTAVYIGYDTGDFFLVRAIRDDGRLRDEVSTVDNAETILGWVAAVLALEAGHNGSVGHYGFREGADGAIPARGV